jgi:hypothetical protein
MLTQEVLIANELLKGLSEEQIKAIVNLSQNDENAVIAKRIGEIYGALDNDILAASGVEKNGTEKTYDYAKRVLGDFKTKVDSIAALNTQIADLTKEKTRLENVIKEGSGNEETAKQLKQVRKDFENITKQYNELNQKYLESEQNHAKELFNLKVDSELQSATGKFKFKAGLPESVTKIVMSQAIEKIKGMSPELIDDGKGGKTLVFKGTDGAIMRNPANQLNPYSPAELLEKELNGMGVLEAKRTITGTGTTPPAPPASSVIDVTGAKTRVEAYDIISAALLAQGKTVGSEAFEAAMAEAWKENNIAQLPEK